MEGFQHEHSEVGVLAHSTVYNTHVSLHDEHICGL